MHSFKTILATGLMASLVAAQTTTRTVHVVEVGSTEENLALTFRPNKLVAEEGDMIQFQFRAGNHTVTQSTFDNPCMPMHMFTDSEETGIYTGFRANSEVEGDPTFTVRILNTDPMWLYCSQGRHCQNGMTMVVNENPSANSTRTLETYNSLAAVAEFNLPGDADAIPAAENNGDADGEGINGPPADPNPNSATTPAVPAAMFLATFAAAAAALIL